MSVTLDPTTPADSESPRQGASRIRALTLQVLSLFSQGGGSSVTFTNAPFTASTTGEITAAGLKQICSVRALKVVSSVTVTTSATTIATQSITMPSLGGPFRILVQYTVFTSGAVDRELWVTDGTNIMASSLFDAAEGTKGCLVSSEFSPVTYANAATVTMTLKGQAATSSFTAGGNSSVATHPSRLILTAISSV